MESLTVLNFLLCLMLAWAAIGASLALYAKLYDFYRFPLYTRIPQNLREKWEGRLVKSVLAEYLALILAPFACLFVTLEYRTDRVKRFNEPSYRMKREYLLKPFRWMQSHYNALDEGYFGMFFYEDVPVNKYRENWWYQYSSRVLWVWRNAAYDYLYYKLGVTHEEEPKKVFEEGSEDSGDLWVRIEIYSDYFLYEAQIPSGEGKYKAYKFGYKSHRSAPALSNGTKNVMYANRIVTNKRNY